jgi:hypothetical protein
VPRPKHLDEDGLVELAHRKLNLNRARWIIECILFTDHASVRTTQLPSGRRVDRGVDVRTRAELEPAVLAAIAESVAELRHVPPE